MNRREITGLAPERGADLMQPNDPLSNAPWSPDQVASLIRRQAIGHPYTCPSHSHVPLWIERDGSAIRCLYCDYKQTWVHLADTQIESIPDLWGEE